MCEAVAIDRQTMGMEPHSIGSRLRKPTAATPNHAGDGLPCSDIESFDIVCNHRPAVSPRIRGRFGG